MIDALQFEFMQNALLAGLLASVICGIIGTLVVVNRMAFLAGGIAHSAYGGIGIAAFSGLPYIVGAAGFATFSGLLMACVTLKAKQRADTIIGVMWALGMATGIIMLDITPGYNVDLMSYLFGSILTVPNSDLVAMAVLAAVISFIVFFYYRDFLAMSYDEEFAQVRGVPVRLFYFLLIGMISLAVVMIVQVVGLILVIALLTIPPYISEKYTYSLAQMICMSTLLGCVFITGGLFVSYYYDLTSGATIIMMGGLGFLISEIVQRVLAVRYKMRWLQEHDTSSAK